jgi:predicted acyl esterase
VTAARSCLPFGPRVPCSGMSQIDIGVSFSPPLPRGFHVLLQSCHGTGGSTGRFEPFRNEAADGQATVAWLREQDWFSGRLGTIGASYQDCPLVRRPSGRW